jgi:large subunit ribosomal protein L22
MEIKAYIKYNKVTPKKLRFLLDDVKKRTPVDALNFLFYNPRRSGKALYKGIKSAVDNAKSTFKIDENLLKFKTLIVEMGPSLKRYNAGSKGSAKPFTRKMSHIKIVLETIEVKDVKSKELGVKQEKVKIKMENEEGKEKMKKEDEKGEKKTVKKVINKTK